MKTNSEILADNPTLASYRVTLNEDAGTHLPIVFDCFAEDEAHATEQAVNAYPHGQVLTTTPHSD